LGTGCHGKQVFGEVGQSRTVFKAGGEDTLIGSRDRERSINSLKKFYAKYKIENAKDNKPRKPRKPKNSEEQSETYRETSVKDYNSQLTQRKTNH
jgi:hypothetical protein